MLHHLEIAGCPFSNLFASFCICCGTVNLNQDWENLNSNPHPAMPLYWMILDQSLNPNIPGCQEDRMEGPCMYRELTGGKFDEQHSVIQFIKRDYKTMMTIYNILFSCHICPFFRAGGHQCYPRIAFFKLLNFMFQILQVRHAECIYRWPVFSKLILIVLCSNQLPFRVNGAKTFN